MGNQLTGGNLLEPIRTAATEFRSFCSMHVCSICKHHPNATPTEDRDTYEIHCLNCGMPIIAGGYISIYDLREQEANEWDTRTKVRETKDIDEAQTLKDLGFS